MSSSPQASGCTSAYLAGDLHHYRRHEETAEPAAGQPPMQKITAGGGGAFLHPTHEEDVSLLAGGGGDRGRARARFELKTTYPDMRRSARLAWRQSPVPLHEPAVRHRARNDLPDDGVAGGRQPPARGDADQVARRAAAHGVAPSTRHPGLALWVASILGAFLAFTDTHTDLYRVLGGAVALRRALGRDLLPRLGCARPSPAVAVPVDGPRSDPAPPACATFAGGWVVGSFMMGLYLLVSLNVFGRHSEEAFSGAADRRTTSTSSGSTSARDGALTI